MMTSSGGLPARRAGHGFSVPGKQERSRGYFLRVNVAQALPEVN
jgi:hypothetical protein